MHRTPRILAIDDNPVNLTVLKSLLGEFTLRTASSGAEALEIAAAFRPDVILLDIIMPGIDGYATCRRIRANPALRHTKIIMVSAKSRLQERLAGYEAGADDYIIKPFDGDELLAKVRVYVKLKSVEEVEEVKNRTIEVLQHSNRTPLANIISYAELLTLGDELDEQTRADAPEIILRHAHRLHRLLEKGTTLASMKAGQFLFHFERKDLCDVIQSTVREMSSAVADRSVTIASSLPPSLVATFDPGQMEFVVRALLDNAIRFSQPGGTIRVELTLFGDELLLMVADDGEGVAADLLPRVFEPFGNPESPLLNRGDGLSMAIAQQIAWAHDADLRVDSRLGSGAIFEMRMPIAGPQSTDRIAEPACSTAASTP